MCERKCSKWTGVIILTLIVLFFIGLAILSGLSAELLYHEFAGSNWNSINGFLIFGVVFVGINLVFGYIAFISTNKVFIFIFLFFWIVSVGFSLAISVLAFVFGSIDYDNSKPGCSDSYHGVATYFEEVDNIMIAVNNSLCSDNCPCAFTNAAAYDSYPGITSEKSFWTRTNGVATNFEECSDATIFNVWADLEKQNDTFTNLDQGVFYDMFRNIEEKFKCSGWCRKSYPVVVQLSERDETVKARHIVRYLFSDLDMTPIPDQIGHG